MDGALVLTESFEFPCSFAQRRVWIDDRLSAGSAFYNIHTAIRLPYLLQSTMLEKALRELVARHESLRTTFIERDGAPFQRVARTGVCDFATENVARLTHADRERIVRERSLEQAGQPFDLGKGPLLRVRLLQTAGNECVLILTVHHIVADAWSMSVLFRDLNEIYAAIAEGRRHSLVELPIQYADYSVWQHQPADSGSWNASLAYWRKRLAGLSTLELPTDRPRAPVISHRGRTLHFTIDATLAAGIFRFARARALTPFNVLLAALAVVLQRNCAQDEVVVGVPVAGRDRIELENLIGFLVNMLVLRLDLGGEPSFNDLAARVQRTLQEALAHQAIPFDRLVEELRPARDLSRNPLFQVSAQYLVSPMEAERGRISSATVLDIQRGASNFDLSFDFWPEEAALGGRVDYSTDLFDETTVNRWIGQMLLVLEQTIQDPVRSIETLNILSEKDRAHLLEASVGARTSYPRESTLARRFSEMARLHSDALALTGHGVSWSYAELDRRSAAIAGHLGARGARPGGFIGVALSRSPEQVAAILGILRFGSAYVALDPAWPAARLLHCLRIAQIGAVICDEQHAARFAELGVDALHGAEALEIPSQVVEPATTSPLSPAYVAFTSGSTGVPKAVVVPHRAVLRLACDNPDIPVHAQDRFMVYAPLAFDASTLEIWGALLNGACLCLAPAGTLGLDELADWMDIERVSFAWMTAGLFHQLAESRPGSLARVPRLYAGGDVLGVNAIRRVLSEGSAAHCVLNGYGPTENTTFTTLHEMRRSEEVSSPVPIGRPVANGYVLVLDARGRMTPIGVSGELLAGGDGVALGYLGEAEASARSFVPDPVDPARGRVYRTGDRVRWRADGVLEFLGRMDRQVKVRGYRVEPAEIEVAIKSLAGVCDACVRARADGSGDKHLAAHVAAVGGITAADITRHLGDRLPSWMIPTEVHVRPELRLAATGKVDEAALVDVEASTSSIVIPEAALDGELEILVAEVWQEVLSQPIGRDTNFFTEAGGHSLLATQAVSRLNAALGIRTPLAAIFEDPTPRRFARRLEPLLLADAAMAVS